MPARAGDAGGESDGSSGPDGRAARAVAKMLETDAFSAWLGIELVEVAHARASVRMTVRDEMVNGFGVAQVPETWVVDPNGFVRRRFIGTVSADGLSGTIQAMREGAP